MLTFWLFLIIRSLSNILLLQTDKRSDMQVKIFTKSVLEIIKGYIKEDYLTKYKVGASVKAIFREYIEVLKISYTGLYSFINAFSIFFS